MKKTLTIFLVLVFVFVLKSFLMTKAFASEEFGGTERVEESYTLKTGENLERDASAESGNDKITLQTAIEIHIELIEFWHGMNPDSLVIRLTTQTEGLVLTYCGDITDGVVGVLNVQYLSGKEETSQSMRIQYGDNIKEIIIDEIIINIEFKESSYLINFEARVKSAPETIDSKKEELKVPAEGINESAAKLSFKLVSREDPGYEPEVNINTVLQIAMAKPNEQENPTEAPIEEATRENPSEGPKDPDVGENKEQEKGGITINGSETNGKEKIYAVIIAAGGAALLVVTTVLIIRNKRRKI